jgi:hypothetical protein
MGERTCTNLGVGVRAGGLGCRDDRPGYSRIRQGRPG